VLKELVTESGGSRVLSINELAERLTVTNSRAAEIVDDLQDLGFITTKDGVRPTDSGVALGAKSLLPCARFIAVRSRRNALTGATSLRRWT